MKTVVIRSLITTLTIGGAYIVDELSGLRFDISQNAFTDADIVRYKKALPKIQKYAYRVIRPMLEKGGFIFDPSLWQWRFEKFASNRIGYWVTLTFTDDSGASRSEMMQWIKETGLLNYDFEIIKPYG